MKKCLAILLSLCLLLLPACADGTDMSTQTSGSNSTDSAASSKSYGVGKSAVINSASGKYSVTIDSIKESTNRNDTADSQPKHIIIINYTFKNISCKQDLTVSFAHFHVYGADGALLKTYPSTDAHLPEHTVSAGKHTSASAAYGLDDGSKQIRIELYDTFAPANRVAIYSGDIK